MLGTYLRSLLAFFTDTFYERALLVIYANRLINRSQIALSSIRARLSVTISIQCLALKRVICRIAIEKLRLEELHFPWPFSYPLENDASDQATDNDPIKSPVKVASWMYYL